MPTPTLTASSSRPVNEPVRTLLVFSHSHDPLLPRGHYHFSKLHSIHSDGPSAERAVRSLVALDPPRGFSGPGYTSTHWMDWVCDGAELSKKQGRRKALGQGYQFMSERGKFRSIWYQVDESMRVVIHNVQKLAEDEKRKQRIGEALGVPVK